MSSCKHFTPNTQKTNDSVDINYKERNIKKQRAVERQGQEMFQQEAAKKY